MLKKIISFLTAAVFVLAMLCPAAVMADETDEPAVLRQERPKLTVNTDSLSGSFRIDLSELLTEDDESVEAAVWSEVNGQDDLIWYTLEEAEDGSYLFEGNIKDHKYDSGKYNFHLYRKKADGKKSFIDGTVGSFSVKYGSVASIDCSEGKETEFRAELTDAALPGGIVSAKAAVWSEENGQDDLKWYQAEKGENGSWYTYIKIKEHSSAGIYNVHFYGSNAGGKYICLGGTNKMSVSANKGQAAALADEKGNIRIELSSFEAPSGIKKAEAAVWSQQGGQDDLEWISLKEKDGIYYAETSYIYHKLGSGRYTAHIYISSENGIRNCVSGVDFDLKISGNKYGLIAGQSVTQGSFNAKISIPNLMTADMKSIDIAVWSEENGQDDLKWYKAVKQNDGSYYISGNIKNHKYSLGKYNLHAYLTDKNNRSFFIGWNSLEFRAKSGAMTVKDVYEGTADKEETIYKSAIYAVEIPGGTAGVKAAVWSSTGGQDDLFWYNAIRTEDGSYSINIDIRRHKTAGNYNIHFYGITKSGKSVFLNGTNKLLISQIGGKITAHYDLAGNVFFNINTVKCPSGVAKAEVAFWSEVNGQDDLEWVRLEKKGDIFTGNTSLSRHRYDQGRYSVHFYMTSNNGIRRVIGTPEFDYLPSSEIKYDGSFNYLAIGNSATIHGKNSSWWNICGMSASEPSKDYYHQIVAFLESKNESVSAKAVNIANWERGAGYRNSVVPMIHGYLSDKLDLVTIMIGENVVDLSSYESDFRYLIDYVKKYAPNAKLILVDEFMNNSEREAIKRRIAKSYGIPLVELPALKNNSYYKAKIGDIVYDELGQPHRINDQAVANHPNDAGMKYIAERITAEIDRLF